MTTTTRKTTTARKATPPVLLSQEPEVLVHPAEQAGMKVHQLAESGVVAAVDTVKDVAALAGTAAGYVGHFFKGLVKGH